MKSELSTGTSRISSLDAASLIRECGRNLQDAKVWEEFYSRYRRKILLYLLRAFRMLGGHSEEFARYADDWIQDLFTKLVQNDGRIVRSFRGTTDISVGAFLSSIAVSVVSDQLRAQRALRRAAQFIPFEELTEHNTPSDDGEARISATLAWIDIERILQSEGQSKTPERDLLIFKLYFVEGLNAREIASITSLNLTTSGLEKVLNRAKSRLVEMQGE